MNRDISGDKVIKIFILKQKICITNKATYFSAILTPIYDARTLRRRRESWLIELNFKLISFYKYRESA